MAALIKKNKHFGKVPKIEGSSSPSHKRPMEAYGLWMLGLWIRESPAPQVMPSFPANQGEEALELFANNPFKVDLIQRKARHGKGCVFSWVFVETHGTNMFQRVG